MSRTVVITGRVVGPSTVELESPLPERTREVKVLANVGDRLPGKLSDYVRSLPPGTRSKGGHRPPDLRGTRLLVLMRLYLDANPIIYCIEGIPPFRQASLDWIARAEADGVVITSRLSRLECRVRPLRHRNAELLGLFEGFFSREGLDLVEVSDEVIEMATELRAEHDFRAPDAIHLASALVAEADVFLTGDRALRRCPGLTVEVLSGPLDAS